MLVVLLSRCRRFALLHICNIHCWSSVLQLPQKLFGPRGDFIRRSPHFPDAQKGNIVVFIFGSQSWKLLSMRPQFTKFSYASQRRKNIQWSYTCFGLLNWFNWHLFWLGKKNSDLLGILNRLFLLHFSTFPLLYATTIMDPSSKILEIAENSPLEEILPHHRSTVSGFIFKLKSLFHPAHNPEAKPMCLYHSFFLHSATAWPQHYSVLLL